MIFRRDEESWRVVGKWFHNLQSKKYMDVYDETLKQLGKEIADKVVNHIRAQDLNWKPLAVATANRKGSNLIYMDTQKYVRSIRRNIRSQGADKRKLTIKVAGKHPSGLSMQQLAMYLEYGTSTIPSRPLWRPVFKEVKSLSAFRKFADTKSAFGV